ncbi:GNAT family N-acetyltransferase [Nonomuraea angiospora]|uniref:GNAT family N-acetyltransferase n=1 Tax=Nonomuraea angiospora TaxID=46172 RepID=UPI0029B37547|nr:GNAT family N-acetyltransferase [Nonomuraea angiospora]MDX3103816.1 GNAT family N-acetyltransferase [Nonomuraea angiospora]
MLVDHFPPAGLRLTTPRLELRLPSPEELAELADLAAGGVHDPDASPFLVRWTDAPPAEAARSVIHYHWRQLGAWTAREWSLDLTVFRDGVVAGQQSLAARDLGITRQVRTTSWLGRRHQGQGAGTEMRAAVLHLAFAGLGAEEALSGALEHNVASLAVSRKLGYEPDGRRWHALDGRMVVEHRFRLSREAWERHRTVPVQIDGLEPCLPLMGLDAPPAAAGSTWRAKS